MALRIDTRRPAWLDNPDLMARLTKAQNHPANENRDVMTFAGFCDDRRELERHVIACEAVASVALDPDDIAPARAEIGLA